MADFQVTPIQKRLGLLWAEKDEITVSRSKNIK